MKKLILITLYFFAILCSFPLTAFAPTGGLPVGHARPQVEEVDTDPSGYYWKLIFDNGTLTANADGTITHSIDGFGALNYLNLSGSNADQNIDIGSYDFTADIGTFGSLLIDDISIDGSSILAGAGASGILTLGGTGGTNDNYMEWDFETSANRVYLTLFTTGIPFLDLVNTEIRFGDDRHLMFGSNFDVGMGWETTGNENFQIGTDVGAAGRSGYVSLMKRADMGHANRSPSSTSANPVFRIYSSDVNEADDYIEIYHDQSSSYFVNHGNMCFNSINGDFIFNEDGFTSVNFTFQESEQTMFRFRGDRSLDQNLFLVSDDGGNQMIFGNTPASQSADHDHILQTNPTFYFHSDLNPNTTNNQWGSLHHSQENFIITTGVNVGTGSGATTNENAIVFAPRGVEQVRIAGAGNVGINDVAPAEKLDVDGNINVTGVYKVADTSGLSGTYPVYNDGTTGNVTEMVFSGGILTGITLAP